MDDISVSLIQIQGDKFKSYINLIKMNAYLMSFRWVINS